MSFEKRFRHFSGVGGQRSMVSQKPSVLRDGEIERPLGLAAHAELID